MTNSLDEVSRLPLFLEEIAEETGMGMAEMMSLNVALEEALQIMSRSSEGTGDYGIAASTFDE